MQQSQDQLAGWAAQTLVLGCKLVLLTAMACTSLVAGVEDRSAAFIGYTETAGYGHCQDKLASCEKDSSLNKCLTDPYKMRKFCPFSCGVEPCVNTGTYLDKYVFKGHASKRGTELYAASLVGSVGVNHFQTISWGPVNITDRKSPPLELQLSSLGLGTYLGAADEVTDDQVLSAVLYSATRGWNVIDTASNYRNGRSEAAIGRALSLLLVGNSAEEFPEGRAEVTRDALFISSKAGFLNAELKQQLLAQGAATSADIMGGSHCLTPACIRASVTASLDKLRIQTLDLLYLHNAAEVQYLARGKAAFFEVLKNAFKELGKLRHEGKIRGYGLATWDCFRQPPEGPLHLNLEEVVSLAKEVGGKHHGFLAIQLPINIKMTEAFSERWQLMVNRKKTEAAVEAAVEAALAAQRNPEAPTENLEEQIAAEADGEVSETGRMVVKPPPPPPPPPPIIYDNMTLLQAAKKLKVAVFASGPLMEAQLLHGLVGPLDHILGLKDAKSTAMKLVQYVRSVPSVACVLLGQKAQEHVEANVALAAQPKLADKMWDVVRTQVAEALREKDENKAVA